ncbi:MAG: hypothetical protein ACK5YI_14380, partial [Rhodospirillales bacterium]
PSDASIIRLLGAVLLEQNDEWSVQTRYMQVEAMAELAATDTADPIQIPPPAARPMATSRRTRISTSLTDVTSLTAAISTQPR